MDPVYALVLFAILALLVQAERLGNTTLVTLLALAFAVTSLWWLIAGGLLPLPIG
jgi:hypothetical protein